MRIRRQHMLCILLVATWFTVSAQNLFVKAPREVQLGQSFEVTFVVEGGDMDNLILPNFDAFEVVGGPMRSTQVSIVNGQTSKSATIGYQLLASKPGNFTLGSASISIGGRKIVTRPVTIKVIASNNNQVIEGGDGGLFTRLELSPKLEHYYVGQQLVAKYVVYYNKDIQLNEIFDEPNYDHFFSQEMKMTDNENSTQVVNGKTYNRAVLKAVVLFAQKEGVRKLGGFKSKFGISEESGGGGFFSMKRYRPVVITSNDVNIDIISLPSNAPASFSGAIGHYDFSASVDRTTLKAKETLKLTLSINGDGDGKLINGPKLDLGKNLEVYEPNKTSDDINYNGNFQEHKTSFEYFVIPDKEGTYQIQPEFSYFNPDEGKYLNLKSEQFTINVLPSTTSITNEDMLEEQGPFSKGENRPSWLYGLIGALAFGGIGGLIWILFKRFQSTDGVIRDSSIQKERKNTKGNKPVGLGLELPAPELPDFYQKMYRYLFDICAKRYNVDPHKATIMSLVNLIHEERGETVAESFKKVLIQCEERLYGGVGSLIEKQNLEEEVKTLVKTHF